METKRFSVIVSGKVQGVGFRFFTRETAKKYHVSGWVRNTADGCVEMEVQGYDNELSNFLRDVEIGPILSFVASIDCREIPAIPEENGFVIKH